MSHLQGTHQNIQAELKNIIITNNIVPYKEIKEKLIPDAMFGDVFHTSEQSRDAF
jgi:hypothetical protein